MVRLESKIVVRAKLFADCIRKTFVSRVTSRLFFEQMQANGFTKKRRNVFFKIRNFFLPISMAQTKFAKATIPTRNDITANEMRLKEKLEATIIMN